MHVRLYSLTCRAGHSHTSPLLLVQIRDTYFQVEEFRGPETVNNYCNMTEARPPGVFRGWPVTLVRDTPCHVAYFLTYEGGKELLEPGSRATGKHRPLALLVAGAHFLTLKHIVSALKLIGNPEMIHYHPKP